VAFALASMRGFLSFYSRLFVLAFKHSYGISDALGFVALVVVGVAGRYYPMKLAAMSNLFAWQIPLLALGVVFAVRLLFAPYWMYRERDKQAVEIGNLLAARTVSDATRAKLLDFWLIGDRLFHQCNALVGNDPLPKKQVDTWIEDVEQFIQERFPSSIGEVYLKTFREDAGFDRPRGVWDTPQAQLRALVESRRHRLGLIHGIVNMRGLSTLD
jgi:hypothetical protein